MKPIRFDFFNKNEFTAFLDNLPAKDAAKFLAVLDDIKERGLPSAEKRQLVKKLENNLYEIRSKFSNNIQRAIYFRVEGSHYVITHGFTKKQQKTPKKEIKHAKQIRAIYNTRRDHHGRR
ncbi:type II toxin-antitoxin system RelE/ParE family toxin [Levilactobacillus brevis]|uniref:Type II toxin-antitoxin system RelE/ParE family toxin n=1 Tax=Levilactobacillus hammesii TaxID=267633 RepID=A0A921JY01_9LACO|nr:type II toxin-antitoxin system RelE/ParE family toxin [Levilactobacillus brevis]HJE87402.1 type II toxin-antitoxin system RelE/ParE family toxin [Levilactobacillus hammesii]